MEALPVPPPSSAPAPSAPNGHATATNGVAPPTTGCGGAKACSSAPGAATGGGGTAAGTSTGGGGSAAAASTGASVGHAAAGGVLSDGHAATAASIS